MPNGPACTPRLAVILPLDDARGDELHHLRSWTERQTCPREQFQLILGTDGSRPDLQTRARTVLAPHDRVVPARRGSHERTLCDIAARAADADLLLFTELHCVAHPTCVERIIRHFDEQPETMGGYLTCEHQPSAPLGDLEKRMLEENEQVTLAPDHWFKLHTDAFVMRRQAYLDAGGLDGRYGLFADAALAARAHERGMRMGRVMGATLTHLTSPSFAVHQGHIEDWTRGECLYRAAHEVGWCERYFGHAPEWTNRYGLKRDAERAAILAVLRVLIDDRTGPWFKELADRLPAALLGSRARIGAAWAATRWTEFVTRRLCWNKGGRWVSYRRSAARLVRFTRLASALEHARRPVPVSPTPSRWSIEAIPESQRVGFHGLERHAEQAFRWTEPVALLKLALPRERVSVTIETRGLRGESCAYVRNLFWDGRPVSQLELAGGRISGVLDARCTSTAWLTLVASPLLPTRHGVPDERRLGVPIFSLDVQPA